ncbi:MAG TPA: type II toxin-antitoxin system VapC family toxin [Stellaceae bacterium]|nr:type II toxin-antitoxin system VapC family toxin [Stellaceae bacterium]
MTSVVDASVAVKWFFIREPLAAEAYALLRGEVPPIAPDIIVAEACNAAWKSLRLGRIRPDKLSEIAARLPQHFGELVDSVGLAPSAVAIAAALDHPVYDCLYLALAEARGVPFITADERLLLRLDGSPWAARAVSLAEYRPAR